MATDQEPAVLLVEDDIDIREELAALLEAEGYRVVQASNGQEALERLRTVKPCVILLDLMMPVMSGWDFRARQLADPSLAEIPTVVLSGTAHAADEAKRLKATAFLQKPFDLNPLLRTVAEFC